MKVFLDTSILIRLFTHDLPAKVEECERIFELIKEGKIKPYLSSVVYMELIFVLTRQYKFKKSVVVKVLEDLSKLRNLTLIEKTNTKQALQLYNDENIKYGDCLIAGQIPKGVILVTYDADFSKIPSIKSVTPDKVTNPKTIN